MDSLYIRPIFNLEVAMNEIWWSVIVVSEAITMILLSGLAFNMTKSFELKETQFKELFTREMDSYYGMQSSTIGGFLLIWITVKIYFSIIYVFDKPYNSYVLFMQVIFPCIHQSYFLIFNLIWIWWRTKWDSEKHYF